MYELLSLIGSLSFAFKVVKPGHIFLRRLIDLSTTVSKLDHHISLNAESRADIDWWYQFLPDWNGVCIIQSDIVSSLSIDLFTDASGIGGGVVYGNDWFALPWPDSHTSFHINILELLTIVAAVFTWGHEWRNQQILFFTDNAPITFVWLKGTSPDSDIMKLVRALFLFCARMNINVLMQHIPGYINCRADALSRLQIARFRALHPGSSPLPSVVPAEVLTILI